MRQRERTARQRILAEEALGKLRAVTQLFGVEDEVDMSEHMHQQSLNDYVIWEEKIKEFAEWIWDESPIA